MTYVATAPKSNAAYLAIDEALKYVKTHTTQRIPAHLQDKHYKGAEKLGHGLGYLYPHDFENHYVDQQYRPKELIDIDFYKPTQIGFEKNINEYIRKIRKEKEQ